MAPWFYIVAGSIIAIVGGGIATYGWHLLSVNTNDTKEIKETINKESNVTREHLDNALKNILQQRRDINEKYPGYSSHMVVQLYEQEVKRRKYLIDIGEKNGERFSAYFDPSNIFTLSMNLL